MNSKLIMNIKIIRTLILCALVLGAPVLFVGAGEKAVHAAQTKKTTKTARKKVAARSAAVRRRRARKAPPKPSMLSTFMFATICGGGIGFTFTDAGSIPAAASVRCSQMS